MAHNADPLESTRSERDPARLDDLPITLIAPGEKVPSNRRATHPVNAMLNYAYGMLEIRTRIAIIADGFDPTIGIVHGDTRADRDTFVFDRMEPGRPEAERRVLALLNEHEFSTKDFGVSENGTCRINPQACQLLGLDAQVLR